MVNNIINKDMLLLLVILLTLTCKKTKIEGPAIRFKNEVYNFGEVKQEGTVSHTFSYYNPGSDTLVLENVNTSCPSCTIVEEYDKIIAPGRKGKMRITYKASGIPRFVDHKIYITTNILDGARIILTLNGNITEEEKIDTIQVLPDLLDFGRLEATDSIRDCSVRLYNFFEKPLFITDITTSNKKTEVWVEATRESKEYIIYIRLHSPFKKGENRETITLKTNLEEQPEILVPYVYSFNPEE
jgi:hypothetical protein